MSVVVEHLNADSTFLLIFSPDPQPPSSDVEAQGHEYRILIDPWLVGPSVVNAKWFAVTERTVPSSITHLSQIECPDLLLVSQNKPDHCHKETLLQLDRKAKCIIAAEPGAAKTIKSWHHFDDSNVHALDKFDSKASKDPILRIKLAPLGPEGMPGEITVAFIPARNYLTGLHNAFGITYRAPTKHRALATVTTFSLSDSGTQYGSCQQGIPGVHDTRASLDSNCSNSEQSRAENDRVQWHDGNIIRPSQEILASDCHRLSDSGLPHQSEMFGGQPVTANPACTPNARETVVTKTELLSAVMCAGDLAADALYRSYQSSGSDRGSSVSEVEDAAKPSIDTLPTSKESRQESRDRPGTNKNPPRHVTVSSLLPRAVSVMYSPHGVTFEDLLDYVQSFLVKLPGALPLTCLLHGFDWTSNPWWLGGNITTGAAGGFEIAQTLMAQCWISAHDEAKQDRGIAVKMLKSVKTNAQQVQERVAMSSAPWICDVLSLDVGSSVKLTSKLSNAQSNRV